MAHNPRRKLLLAAAAVAAFSAVAAVQLNAPRTPPASPFHRVTFEGDASYPALSPDGKRLVYCLPSGPRHHSLWIRDIDSDSQPRRLTEGSANDYDAVFSPDGAFVYFTSDRAPEGIYRISASGGGAERIRAGGLTARFSPDGHWLLSNGAGGLVAAPAGGGPAHSVTGGLTNCYAPVWSPDSRSIAFACGDGEQNREWWIVSPDGGEPRSALLAAGFARAGFNDVELQAWLPGNELIFAGRQGETMTLWRIGFDPVARTVTHPSVRATDDPAGDTGATFAAGKLAFARTRVGLNLWNLPLDSDGGISAAPTRLTSTPSQKGSASLSRDGRTLLFSEERDGAYSLYLRDLPSGKEREIASGAFLAALRPDGSRFAYARGPMDHLDVLAKGTGWWWRYWFSRSVCDGCGVPRGFAPDGSSVLLWADDHVDLASSQQVRRILAAPAGCHIYAPQLSPDARAVVFGVRCGEHEIASWIAPLHPNRPTPDFEWIGLMPRGDVYHIPFWSPSTDLLYILSNHGGGNLRWLEAQPIDPATLHLRGERRAVYEFHYPRVPMMDPLWNPVMSIPGKILLEMGDITTDIWIGRPGT